MFFLGSFFRILALRRRMVVKVKCKLEDSIVSHVPSSFRNIQNAKKIIGLKQTKKI